MTRGVIAFVDYDKDNDRYLLYVSQQFNGDMGPDMAKGKKFFDYFRKIYLNKKDHTAKRYKMERIVRAMIDEFKYDCDGNFVKCIPLEGGANDNIRIDLLTKYLDPTKKTVDYENDVWSSLFGYPDYVYIVPLCCAENITVLTEDDCGGSEEHVLDKDWLDVLYFRSYAGFVDPKDGKYSDYNEICDDKEILFDDSDEDEEKKESVDLEPDEEEKQDPVDFDEEAPKKYVEIISQYNDNGVDCLVVRTDDNKHVLFKQMR